MRISRTLANTCLILGMLFQADCVRGPDPKQVKMAQIEYDLGVENLRAGKIREALASFLKAEKLHPDFAELQHSLGLCYYFLGRYDDAVKHFDRALELKPSYSVVYNEKARVYLDQGLYRLAVPLLEKALEDVFLRNRFIAEANLGWAYFKLGKKEKGYRLLKNALAQNDKYCIGYHYLGLMYREDKDLERAEENLKKVGELCPALLQAWFDLAKVQTLRGKLGEACSSLKRCFEPSKMTPLGERCWDLYRSTCEQSPEKG
ncbi:MAG: tetratricopeptide repeat protein [Deltaproteobacteria bacterium]|nr:MAG: tetratricopeptide repeat protein [Deltaproteobacteria bacterium]